LVTELGLSFAGGYQVDPVGREGLSYLAAQMFLRGSHSLSAKDWLNKIDSIGATAEVSVAVNRTTFFFRFENRQLDKVLELIQDALVLPRLSLSELKNLKSETTINLKKIQESAYELSVAGAKYSLFNGSRLQYDEMGTMRGIARVKIPDIRRHWRRYFVQKNLVITVATALSQERIGPILRQWKSKLRTGEELPEQISVNQWPQGNLKVILIDRPELKSYGLALVRPGSPTTFDLFPELEVANSILGGGFSSRIFTRMRGELGWAYAAYSDYYDIDYPTRTGSVQFTYIDPPAEYLVDAAIELIKVIDGFYATGPTEGEMKEAIENATNAFPFRVAFARDRLQRTVEDIFDGRPQMTSTAFNSRLNQVSISRIKTALSKEKILGPAHLVVVGDLKKVPRLNEIESFGNSVQKINIEDLW
jgi:predicted Zn-dependent peptidase